MVTPGIGQTGSYDRILYGYVTFPSDIDLRGPYPGVGSLDGRMPVDSLPWDALSHVSFFAADVNSNGSWNNGGNGPGYLYKMPYLAEQAHLRGVYSGFCFGGSGDAGLRAAINNPGAHSALIATCLDLIDNKGQDFIDFDIEGRPFYEDQWTVFAARLYDSLQTRRSHKNPSHPPFIVLTVGITRALTEAIISEPYVEIINIMSYDNAGGWWGQINHDCAVTSWSNIDGTGTNVDPQNHAGQGGKAFPSLQEGARLLMEGGWPREKIVMGADFNPTTVTGGTFSDGRGPTTIRKVWSSPPSWSGSGLKFYREWHGTHALANVPEDRIIFDPASRTYWAHTGTNLSTDKMYLQVSWPGKDSSIYYIRQMVDAMDIGGTMIWGLTETYGTSTPAPPGGWAWLGHQYEKYFTRAEIPPPPPPDLPKLRGTLFFDQNQNGSREDGEPGLAGWTVNLNGDKSSTVLTDSSGRFVFKALPLGEYTLSLQGKPGWSVTLPSGSPSYPVSIDSAGQETTMDFGASSSTVFGFQVSRGWNIVSLPVESPDGSVNGVFPLRLTPAYSFSTVYKEVSVLEPGTGYWIKFPFGHTVWLQGEESQSETTSVVAGWNFIGSISTPVPVSEIQTVPAGILSPYIYGYQNGTSLTTEIRPGRGYWVNSSQPGEVIISSAPSGEPASQTVARRPVPELNRISFHLPSGETANLYYRFSPSDTIVFIDEAPPVPPGDFPRASFVPVGGNDALSGMIATIGRAGQEVVEVPLIVRGAGEVARVSWDIRDSRYGAEIGGGSGLRQTLSGEGSVDLSLTGPFSTDDPADRHFTLRVFSDTRPGVPQSYSLEQNFPNPFNSMTRIGFSIPVTGHVKIELFNILGELMGTLSDDTMDAGVHSISFDASSLATGVYLYRLTADGGDLGMYTAMKKLLLIR